MRPARALLAAAIALVACGQSDSKAPPPPPDQHTPEPPDQLPQTADAGVAKKEKVEPLKPAKLDVVRDGTEPRFALAYQVQTGTRQVMHVSVDETAEMPVAGKVVMPTIVLTAELVVTDVDAQGNISSKATFTEMEIQESRATTPGLAEVLREQIGAVKGTGLTMTITPSGKVKTWQPDALDNPALAEAVGPVQQNLDEMVVELPDKPVGKGAKWTLTGAFRQQGMKIDRVITYEVVEVSATAVKLKGAVTMKAPKQEADQAGSAISLEKLTGTARLDIAIDLTKIVPTLTGDVSMKMTAKIGGNVAESTVKTKTKITAE